MPPLVDRRRLRARSPAPSPRRDHRCSAGDQHRGTRSRAQAGAEGAGGIIWLTALGPPSGVRRRLQVDRPARTRSGRGFFYAGSRRSDRLPTKEPARSDKPPAKLAVASGSLPPLARPWPRSARSGRGFFFCCGKSARAIRSNGSAAERAVTREHDVCRCDSARARPCWHSGICCQP